MDVQFRVSVSLIVPLCLCLLVFALAGLAMEHFLGVRSINELLSGGMMALFQNVPNELGKGVLFVLLTDLLWLFGIHGAVSYTHLDVYKRQDSGVSGRRAGI